MKQITALIAIFIITLSIFLSPSITLPQEQIPIWEVYFSPHGGCTDAIAHNKVMVIDGEVVITRSFNLTKAAEENNAENLLMIHDR